MPEFFNDEDLDDTPDRDELVEALLELGVDEDELKDMDIDELEIMYDDITDTSSMHPNETFDEFMEHEDF